MTSNCNNFRLYIEVDEFKTSKLCNKCKSILENYQKKDGKPCYTRLVCLKCALKGKRKHFVDRDVNAAKNILEIGKSIRRPLCFKFPPGRSQGIIEWRVYGKMPLKGQVQRLNAFLQRINFHFLTSFYFFSVIQFPLFYNSIFNTSQIFMCYSISTVRHAVFCFCFMLTVVCVLCVVGQNPAIPPRGARW